MENGDMRNEKGEKKKEKGTKIQAVSLKHKMVSGSLVQLCLNFQINNEAAAFRAWRIERLFAQTPCWLPDPAEAWPTI